MCLGEFWRTRQKFWQTPVDTRVTSVFTSQMGSLGWVSEFFEVRAQVDRGLTTVDHLTGY
jgi:hypothetical protein